MSIEALIADHTAQLGAMTEALKANTAILERVVAGQQAALEKIEGAKAPTARKPRAAAAPAAEAPAAEAPAAEEPGKSPPEEPAATGSGADGAASASESPLSTLVSVASTGAEAMKAYVSSWTGEGTDEERATKVTNLKAIAAELNVGLKFAELVPHAEKVVFYIERYKLGLPVDLKADYDFAGDPGQGAEQAEDDEFG